MNKATSRIFPLIFFCILSHCPIQKHTNRNCTRGGWLQTNGEREKKRFFFFKWKIYKTQQSGGGSGKHISDFTSTLNANVRRLCGFDRLLWFYHWCAESSCKRVAFLFSSDQNSFINYYYSLYTVKHGDMTCHTS